MEKNELYYVPMLKSVEGKVVPNDDEKETKRLRRSAEKTRRRSAKSSRSRQQESSSQGQESKKGEGDGETTVPKPTPVPLSADTTEKTSEQPSGQSNETDTGGEGLFTLKCLSIETRKTINFPFGSSGKPMGFRCSNIQAHYNEAVDYLSFGTPKNNEFSIWNKWKIHYFRCPNT